MKLGPLFESGTYLFLASLDATSEFLVYAHGALNLDTLLALGGTVLPLFGAEFSTTVVGAVGLDLQHPGIFGSVLIAQDGDSSAGAGAVVGGSNTFNVAFNLTDIERTIDGIVLPGDLQPFLHLDRQSVRQIGRASCRERV